MTASRMNADRLPCPRLKVRDNEAAFSFVAQARKRVHARRLSLPKIRYSL
jgi:hypothetical protein